MRIIEIILLCFLAVALGWFYSLAPGGAFSLMIVLTLLSTLYFAFGFVFFSKNGFRSAFKGGLKNTRPATIVFGVLTGMGLSVLLIGILFKLLLFPGANNMLTVGSIESAIMLCVNTIYFFKTRLAASKLCISRIVIFLIPSVALLVTPSLTVARLQYRNHPAYVDAYAKHLEDPMNPEKWEALNLERNRIQMTDEEFELYKKSVVK
jgi:hypothetical protein